MRRKLLSVSGLLALGLLLGLLLGERRGGLCGGADPCVDGDVNGDGDLNLSDPVYLLGHLFLGGDPPIACGSDETPATLVVLVRHAEKRDDTADPGLTPEGAARAARLAEVLGPAPIGLLIASDLRRTQETLAPLAEAKKLEPEKIAEAADVVRRLRELPGGSLAVVAHHSFTIPAILRELDVEGREKVSVSGDEYDNLLVLVVTGSPKTQMLHLKY